MLIEYSRYGVFAVVKDDKDNKICLPYTKKFDELLVLKNNKESLEKLIEEKRTEIKCINNVILNIILGYLGVSFDVFLYAIIAKALFDNGLYYFWATLYDKWEVGIGLCFLLGTYLERKDIKDWFNKLKNNKELKENITFLENEKAKLDERINELEQNVIGSSALEFGEVIMASPVDTKETERYLLNLKEEMLVLEDFRRNKEEYIKKYKDGSLVSYLTSTKGYNEEKIDIIYNEIKKYHNVKCDMVRKRSCN